MTSHVAVTLSSRDYDAVSTPFNMTVLNDQDRLHLVMDTIDRLPRAGEKGSSPKRQLDDDLIEHGRYIEAYGEDLPEIRNCKWGAIT